MMAKIFTIIFQTDAHYDINTNVWIEINPIGVKFYSKPKAFKLITFQRKWIIFITGLIYSKLSTIFRCWHISYSLIRLLISSAYYIQLTNYPFVFFEVKHFMALWRLANRKFFIYLSDKCTLHHLTEIEPKWFRFKSN